MECPRCKASNPEADKFCGQCGAPLDARLDSALAFLKSEMHEQIDAALDARLKDQTVVEVEIQEHVVERIQKLGKLIGIPLVLFFAVLGVWGIRSLSDVDGKIRQATDDAIKGMNNKVEVATQSSLQALKEKVDRETNDIVESAKKNAKASLTQAAQQATTDLQSQAQ